MNSQRSDAYFEFQRIWQNRFQNVAGTCMKASKAMAKEFPELTVVRGFVRSFDGEPHQHWWCKTEDGKIVDPTRQQFLAIEPITYQEVSDEDIHKSYHGRCPNCGEYFASEDYRTCCSDQCDQDYISWIEMNASTMGHGCADDSYDLDDA